MIDDSIEKAKYIAPAIGERNQELLDEIGWALNNIKDSKVLDWEENTRVIQNTKNKPNVEWPGTKEEETRGMAEGLAALEELGSTSYVEPKE